MAINYNDPRYQNALLSSIARRPYGGIRSNSALTSKWAADQERQRLALAQVYSGGKLREAMIGQMAKDYEIAKAKLGISQGYTGLGWGDIDIAKQKLGLGEKKIGLGERELALKGRGVDLEAQRVGLANQWQDQMFAQENWRRDFLENKLDDEERNLWLSTALGLGTAGWSAYEGARRNKLTQEDAELNRAFRKRMEVNL